MQTLFTILTVAGIFASVLLVVGLCTLLVWTLLVPFERAASGAGLHRMFLACRYLRSHMIVTWSIAGVAIGIMVMVIVTSVMSGFAREIQERIRGTQAHVVVQPLPRFKIGDYERICDAVRAIPHVLGAAPRIEYPAIISYHGYTEQVVVMGIDPAQETGWSEFDRYFDDGGKHEFSFRYDAGAPDPFLLDFTRDPMGEEWRLATLLGKQVYPGIVIGQELLKFYYHKEEWLRHPMSAHVQATELDSYYEVPMLPTSPVSLVTARMEGRPRMRMRTYEVVGHLHTGMSEFDAQVVMVHLAGAQDLLDMPGQVNVIAVQVEDYERNIEQVRGAIEDILGDRHVARGGILQVRTWREVKSNLLQAVAMEKALQVIILFCIVIVAGFNILAIYTLMVRGKTRDIGILRSLGAGRAGIAGIFLWSGTLCGLFGSLIGAFLGLATAFNLNPVREFIRDSFGVDPFPRDIYYLDTIPADVDYRTIAIIVVATMAVGLIASVYPAWRASRQDPIEAIRYE